MDSSESDYQAKLKSTQAQSGLFQIMNEGAGGALTKASRTPIGAPRLVSGEVLDGQEGGFAQDGEMDPYNMPLQRPDVSGSLVAGTSSTAEPQVDPEVFNRRVSNITQGRQGFNGYNDRNRGLG